MSAEHKPEELRAAQRYQCWDNIGTNRAYIGIMERKIEAKLLFRVWYDAILLGLTLNPKP